MMFVDADVWTTGYRAGFKDGRESVESVVQPQEAATTDKPSETCYRDIDDASGSAAGSVWAQSLSVQPAAVLTLAQWYCIGRALELLEDDGDAKKCCTKTLDKVNSIIASFEGNK